MKIEWTFTMSRVWTIDRVLDFVSMANRYACNIYLGRSGKMLNAKGLLGVVTLSLSLGENEAVHLHLEGSDAEKAFEQLAVYLQNPDRSLCELYPQSS